MHEKHLAAGDRSMPLGALAARNLADYFGAESRTVDLGTVTRVVETHWSRTGTVRFEAIRAFWARVVREEDFHSAD